MDEPRAQQDIRQTVLSLQIIVGSFVASVVVFMIVAVVIRMNGETTDEEPANTGVITYVAVGFAVCAVALRLFFANMIDTSVRRRAARLTDSDGGSSPPSIRWAGTYATRTILGSAVIEGAGLFNGVAYLQEGRGLAMAAAGVLVVILAAGIPTTYQVESWVDEQRQRASEERRTAQR